MKALVGVDLKAKYRPALDLFEAMHLAEARVVFAHVCGRYTDFVPGLVPSALSSVRVEQSLRRSGERAVAAALRGSQTDGGRTVVAEGHIAPTLIRLGEELRCSMIVLGSTRSRTSNAWQIGSVTRKLAFQAPQSLLLTKGRRRTRHPLRVVIATDHSSYINRCLDELMRWRPEGIQEIFLVTAYELSSASDIRLHAETMVNLDFEKWVEEQSKVKSEEMAQRLRTICPTVNVIVERGDPNHVIRKTMKSTKSDLLVVGAHGHGFLERMLVGSVSLRQLLAESYPVLLLRCPSK